MRTNKSITLSPRRKQHLLYLMIAIALIGFAAYGIQSVLNLRGSLDSQQIRLKNNQLELQKLNSDLDKAKMDTVKTEVQKQQEIQKLEQEKKDLEAQLQAKAESKAKLAAAASSAINTAVNKATGTQTAYAAAAPLATGSHEDWMAAAGIDPSNYSYVNYIVGRESGWNPSAVNASSGACGLGQQLPCGKWAGAWNDPVAALVAMQGYALARYGSWANAYSFWVANNWW